MDIAPNTSVTINFEDGKITVALASGCAILSADKGVLGTFQVGDATQHTDQAKGGALGEFREAARLAPFYAQPRWQLGNALLRAGAGAEAVAELRRAAESDPSLYPNLVQSLWYGEGRDPRALVRDAQPRTPEETLTVARFLIKNGAADAGVGLLRESAAATPDESRRALLEDLLKAGDYTDAYVIWSDGRGVGRGALTDGGFEADARTDEEAFGWRFARESAGLKFSLDADSPPSAAHKCCGCRPTRPTSAR